LTAGLLTLAAFAPAASAFCGFYVSGASDKLYNNATMVVMMREGQRTVLSMQNNYQGPAEDFAMVVPVPVVLKEENVKTLDPAVFDKVDKMAAPRLVEYWEQDPCYVEPKYEEEDREGNFVERSNIMPSPTDADDGVRIEARFSVAEYNVLVLSATDSSGLDRWLAKNKYNVPKGAKEAYQPYIDGGMYFFVAKVDAKKVKTDPQTHQIMLSPLRFHYDTKAFNLPIRLGLVNANGAQDLIVHILARGQRYQVGNMPNVTIPTNIDVTDDVRTRFGEFYAALFDKTLAKHPGAVVTEYAWDAGTCDPCPGPNLDANDFLSLGADVQPGAPTWGFVLTRLHTRYTKETLKDDLVFEAAPAIIGGREIYADRNELEQGAKPSGTNNFQGRYAIRHVWTGEINCQTPVRGRWGGPPSGTPNQAPVAAEDLAFAPRGKFELVSNVRRSIPELGLTAQITTQDLILKQPKAQAAPPAATPTATPAVDPPQEASPSASGCTVATASARGWSGALVIGLVAAAALVLRRR